MSIFAEALQGATYDLNTAVTADIDSAVNSTQGLRLMGFSCRESAGTPAVASFNIVNGSPASSGDQVILVELAANGSESKWFGPEGIDFQSAISINHLSGEFDVTIFYKKIGML